jgi:hypothetical protein
MFDTWAWRLVDWQQGRGGLLWSGTQPGVKEDHDMDQLWLVLFWTGPVGVGIFLMGLGVLFWGISKVRQVEKK